MGAILGVAVWTLASLVLASDPGMPVPLVLAFWAAGMGAIAALRHLTPPGERRQAARLRKVSSGPERSSSLGRR